MGVFDQWRAELEKARDRAMERGEHLTRAMQRDRPSAWTWLGVAALGAIAGFLAAYLFDPDRGRGRRARYGDQLAAGVRRGADRLGRESRLAAGRLVGVAEDLKHSGDGQPMPNDAALTEKLESELFRNPAIPKGKININAENGVVVLRGEVDSKRQYLDLERQARRVPGVIEVQNLLNVAGEASRVD
jgi:gas vesicle protein